MLRVRRLRLSRLPLRSARYLAVVRRRGRQ